MAENKKIRVNISVDKGLLEKAKTKLNLFGGKLSTLFNAYLSDFVTSMEENYSKNNKEILKRIENIEKKLEKIGKLKNKKVYK